MFSDRLAELRNKHGLSQKQLADILGVAQGSVGNWESGFRKNPPIDTLIRIADYFKVSLDYLLDHDSSVRKNGGTIPADDLTLLIAFHHASPETQNNIRLLLRLPEVPEKPDVDPALSLIEELRRMEKETPSSV